MTYLTYSNRGRPREKAALAPNRNLTKMALQAIRTWWHRYQSRGELAVLSYHQRKDLGFSADLDAEMAKPFWWK